MSDSLAQEQEIIQYLRHNYRPAAIILHGSRAVGMSRPHSDWDIFLLFKDKPPLAFRREEIAGADVEWRAQKVPVTDENLLATFSDRLQFGKVLWQQDSAGTQLLEQAAKVYAKGVQISAADRPMYKQFLVHKLHGMMDDIETPYLFLRHLSEFLNRAVNWWFELRGMHGKPYYLAIPHFQTADPEYHALLMILCGDATQAKKIAAATQVIARIFPENQP